MPYYYHIGEDIPEATANFEGQEYNDEEFGEAVEYLRRGDGIFVYYESINKWRYVVFVGINASGRLIFQSSPKGEMLESPVDGIKFLHENNASFHSKGTAPASPFIFCFSGSGEEKIRMHSITALPLYDDRSFEELRFEDYLAGNKGTKVDEHDRRSPMWRKNHYTMNNDQQSYNWYLKWGGSDINNFLEVDLTTKRIILRRPTSGTMFTKNESLHIINTTTLKASSERRRLIQFLHDNKLVPSDRVMYKLLEKDSKGLSIDNVFWGNDLSTQQHQIQPISETVVFDSDFHDNVRGNVKPKKQELISSQSNVTFDEGDPDGNKVGDDNFARFGLRNESGWKGHIRLGIVPTTFSDLEDMSKACTNPLKLLAFNPYNICSYIGCNYLGPEGEWEKRQDCGPRDRFCRLYFDPRVFPPPLDLNEGGNCSVFSDLKNYIRTAALRDKSPVICNGGKDHKMFVCNRKYISVDGKEKRCPFCFQVRWEKFGYYIHLLNNKAKRYLHNSGQPWHCCSCPFKS